VIVEFHAVRVEAYPDFGNLGSTNFAKFMVLMWNMSRMPISMHGILAAGRGSIFIQV
jgi:hypothetical protein